MIRLSPAIAAAFLIAMTGAGLAQDAGRFAFGAAGDAILRIDTATGAVARCVPAAAGWLCTPVPSPPPEAALPQPAPEIPDFGPELARIRAALDGLAATVAALAARPAGVDLGPAVDALRQQVEALAAAQGALTAGLAAITVPPIAGPPVPDLEVRLAAIETAIAALAARVQAIPAGDLGLRDAVAALAAQQEIIANAVATLTTGLGRIDPAAAIHDLGLRLAAIEQRLTAAAAGDRNADFAETLAGLNEQFAAIEQTIGALRTFPPANGALDAAIAALGDQLAAVATTMAGFTARETDAEVLTALAGLTARLAAVETAIGGLVADPRPGQLLAATTDLRDQVAALGNQQAALADAIAALGQATPALAELNRQVAALPEAIRTLLPDGNPALEALTADIAALGEQLAALAAAGPANAAAIAAIGQGLTTLDGRVVALVQNDNLILPAIADLVARQQAVAQAIAGLPTGVEAQLTPLLAVQSQQTALLRQTITELFAARQTEIAAANAGLAEQLTRIEQQLAAMPADDPAAINALGVQIEALGQRLGETTTALPPEVATLLTTLRDQQAAMDARLVALAAGQPALVDTIGALAAQIAVIMVDDAETARTLAAITEGVLGLRQDVALLAELGGAAPAPGTLTAISDRLTAIETEIRALAARDDNAFTAAVATIADRLTAIETVLAAAPAPLDAAAFGETAGVLRTDIGTLQQAVAGVAAMLAAETADPAIGAIQIQVAELLAAQQTMLARLPERVVAAPETLAAIQSLAAQLSALEARISTAVTAEQAAAILSELGLIVEGQAGIEQALAAVPPAPNTEIVAALDGMTQRLVALEARIGPPIPVEVTATLTGIGNRISAIDTRLSALAPASDGGAIAALRADLTGLRDQITALGAAQPAPDLAPLIGQLAEQQQAMADAIRLLAAEIARIQGTPPVAVEVPPRVEADPPPAAPGFGEELMQRLFGLADDVRGGLN